jgi:type II secretory pathway component PulJ
MTKNQSWEVSYKVLVAYKREHGHCHVHTSENVKLAEWVRTQRRRFSQVGKRRNKLTNDELDRLNAINFPWDGKQSSISLKWDRMLNDLLDYKRDHGDCYVPQRYKENVKKLGGWVLNQRGRNRAKLISGG